jgi:acetylornithine deacetylase/succinyl-diaminopimelate desuccinylase-like protein
MYMHIKAIEALRAVNGTLPLNVKFLIEGEEEVGGASIAKYVAQNPAKLKADVALVSDTAMYVEGMPTLCIGLRGLIYMEVEATGPARDLHSGLYGGAAPNAVYGLIELLAKAKDANGVIQIPGIYDGVEEPAAAELESWKRLPFNEREFLEKEVGSTELTGEPDRTVLERVWSRPTFEVHGIAGGFTAAGAKTVIPAKATAKISMRLVPRMEPARTFAQYKKYVESICPKGVTVDVRLIHSGEPSLIPTDNAWIRASVQAMRTVWNKDTVFIRSGGSIPIVGEFEKYLKIPSVMMGFGLPDDGLHAPNEKFHIPNFHRGIESVIRFFEEAAKS